MTLLSVATGALGPTGADAALSLVWREETLTEAQIFCALPAW